MRRGDILVTKFDSAAVRAGLVSPREVVTFVERGVEVHSVRNLHAKVYVFGRTAVVTSSNVSATSEHRLVEASLAEAGFIRCWDARFKTQPPIRKAIESGVDRVFGRDRRTRLAQILDLPEMKSGAVEETVLRD